VENFFCCFLVFRFEYEPRFFTLFLFLICLLHYNRSFSCRYYNSRNKWFNIRHMTSYYFSFCIINIIPKRKLFCTCRFQETWSSQQDPMPIHLMLLKWTCRMSYTIYLLERNCHLSLWVMSSAWYLMLVTAMTGWMVCHSSIHMISEQMLL